MAGSPKWKVYDVFGFYQAACKDEAAALALANWYGAGATIRLDHGKVVWTEGDERADSYDESIKQMHAVVRRIHEVAYDRINGKGAAAKVRASREANASK